MAIKRILKALPSHRSSLQGWLHVK
jgi:hypothetical protein